MQELASDEDKLRVQLDQFSKFVRFAVLPSSLSIRLQEHLHLQLRRPVRDYMRARARARAHAAAQTDPHTTAWAQPRTHARTQRITHTPLPRHRAHAQVIQAFRTQLPEQLYTECAVQFAEITRLTSQNADLDNVACAFPLQ